MARRRCTEGEGSADSLPCWLPYHVETGTDWWVPFCGANNFDRLDQPHLRWLLFREVRRADKTSDRMECRLRKVSWTRQRACRSSHTNEQQVHRKWQHQFFVSESWR